jgi:hypothetical protein
LSALIGLVFFGVLYALGSGKRMELVLLAADGAGVACGLVSTFGSVAVQGLA